MPDDKIKKAYRSSQNIYDKTLTQKNIWAKLYIHFFWGGADDLKIAETVLSYIPENFSGALLDVPVGSGVFTEKTYLSLPDAEIYCLDFSEDMLRLSRRRFESSGLKNIRLIQGDVGRLPFADESFDIVLSMNGFHAFPDKDKAFAEIFRVLKKQGLFVGCFYIKGELCRTDFLVKHVLARKGWFTPPFFSFAELKDKLCASYEIEAIGRDKAMVWFCCRKQ